MLSPWTSEDLKQHKILDELLSRKAQWSLSTVDAVTLYRSLVWFSSLKAKIESSQAEILSLRQATPEEQAQLATPKARVPGKRATRAAAAAKAEA